MKDPKPTSCIFPSAADDAVAAERTPPHSNSYRLAYSDPEFLHRDDLRAVRLQLEWLKPDLIQEELDINSTAVIFGGARFQEHHESQLQLEEAEQTLSLEPDNPQLIKKHRIAQNKVKNSQFYDEARKLSHQITQASQASGGKDFVIVTGGGPGIMEAANRGAADAGGKSIGLNIVLPYEQKPNPYVTPGLCFQFHYFAIRKMHFLKRARALISCPGGFGTLDELFDTLTLIQTHKIQPVPVILMGREYWTQLINFEFLVEQGAIDEQDLQLFHLVDNAEQAWDILEKHWFSD